MPKRDRPLLTPTQWQVLERLAAGEDNAAIAAALGLSGPTLTGALRAIYQRVPRVEGSGKRAGVAAWYRAIGCAQRALVEPDARAGDAPPLMPLQWRILALLARGANDQEIAAKLGLTQVAVSHQMRRIYRLLPLGGAANLRAAAVVWYLREGHRYYEQAGQDAYVCMYNYLLSRKALVRPHRLLTRAWR